MLPQISLASNDIKSNGSECTGFKPGSVQLAISKGSIV